MQPDAPPEVIKAAYRALIATSHPDVGGDEYEAVLLNDKVIGNLRALRELGVPLPEGRSVPTAGPIEQAS